jgi:hypothetical protein
MGARKEITMSHGKDEAANIFNCRRRNGSVTFVGKDRRQKREDFNKAWWLKVITLTEE